MTVKFSQAAVFVDVRVLEYSGLDTVSPFDVSAGAAGTGTAMNSGAATTTSANELIVGAGTTRERIQRGRHGFHLADHHLAERGHRRGRGGYQHGELQCRGTAPKSSSTWVMQMATFRVSGQGGGNPAPTVSAINPTSGTANGGTAVTITGTGFLAGATVSLGGTAATGVTVGAARRSRRRRRRSGGSGECGRNQHRCSERNAGRWIHIYRSQSGADGKLDLPTSGPASWRDGGDNHWHGIPGGRDSEPGGNGGDRSDRGEQHVDHGDDAGTCGGRGECGRDQYRRPERHLDERLHLHQRSGGGGTTAFVQSKCGDAADRRCVGSRWSYPAAQTAGNLNMVAVRMEMTPRRR